MSSAVPPSRLSRSTQFQHGVTEAARGGMYIAALRLHKPGDEKTVIVEHLGATHPNPWLAAVVHDAALCKRAFDLGKLQSLQHGPAPESNAAATGEPPRCAVCSLLNAQNCCVGNLGRVVL